MHLYDNMPSATVSDDTVGQCNSGGVLGFVGDVWRDKIASGKFKYA